VKQDITIVESEAVLGLVGMYGSNGTKAADPVKAVFTPVIYRAISEQLSGDLGGEAVILSLKTGKYYGLNMLGARIWELLQNPISVVAIEATILAEFDVEADECHEEVSSFISLLEAEELIRRVDGFADEIPSTEADRKGTGS
jgi:hypothetical protein